MAEQQARKKENLQKIRDYMREHDEVANDEIEKLLGVSDATATNYMQELEETGEVRQIGSTGRFVRYTLNG